MFTGTEARQGHPPARVAAHAEETGLTQALSGGLGQGQACLIRAQN